MRSALKQALADCLARLEAGAGIEECLRGYDSLAAELRPLLEGAQALRAHQFADHRPEASQRGRARMHAARIAEAERGRRQAWGGMWRPLALTGVAAVVAVMAALGFTTGVFRFGADTTSAQVDGVVSRVDPDAIIITTRDGRTTIRIGDSTIVLDAMGNPISGGEIAPGRSVRIEVDEQNGEYSARRIEVEDDDHEANDAEVEFKGIVKAFKNSVLTVKASFGNAAVAIGPETRVEGALKPGVTVEVHAFIQGDSTYLGKEIKVKDGGGDGGGGGGDGGGGDGGGGGETVSPTADSGDDHGGDSSGSGSDGDSSDSSDSEPDSSDD